MTTARFLEKPWSSEQVAALTEKLVKAILELYRPRAIYLFGSAAEGRFDRFSDLDVAIICSSPEEVKAAREKLLRRPPLIDWPVDYLFFDEATFQDKAATGGVCELILREGKKIF